MQEAVEALDERVDWERTGLDEQNWDNEQDDKLREIMLVKQVSNWERVAELMDKTVKECSKRYLKQLF